MERVTRAFTAITVILGLAACGGGSDGGSPLRPGGVQSPIISANPTVPPPPQRDQPAQGTGTINLVRVSPDPGASLFLQTCFAGAARRECAPAWTADFDVMTPRDVVWPVLTVAFYDGTRLCGYAAATQPVLSAGATVRFQLHRIFVTDEFGTFAPRCDLPARTTRMVAELWTDADWSFSLKQEFSTLYTFFKPEPFE